MTINRFECLNLYGFKNQNTATLTLNVWFLTFFELSVIKFERHILALKTHD